METTDKVSTSVNRPSPTLRVAILASVAAAMLLILCLTLIFRRHAEEGAESDRRADSSRFLLPMRSVDASDVLGRPRSSVRDLLGQPTLSEATLDSFDAGLPLDIRYDRDVAVGLSMSANGIGRHERQVRRWLHLPADGAIRIGNRPYRFSFFVGDENRISLNLDENEFVTETTAKAVPVVASAAPSAEALLKLFPNLPPRLKSNCRAVAKGKALACSGFNARVSVELDAQGEATALTVLDPPGRSSESDCRAAIEELVPGAYARPPGSRRYVGETADALFAYAPPVGASKPSCSLMVCRKSGDLGSARSPCGE
jgi:hypothetical protein